MFIRLLKWVRTQWRAYCRAREMMRLSREIERAALILGIYDLGFPREFVVGKNGELLVRMHFACHVPARVGVMRSLPERQMYWCYHCKVTWQYDDDDDEGGGRPRRTSPPRPTGWHPPSGWKESETILRRIMEKKSPINTDH